MRKMLNEYQTGQKAYLIDHEGYYSVPNIDALVQNLIDNDNLRMFFTMHVIGLELTKSKAEIEKSGVEMYDFPEGIDSVIEGGKLLLDAFEEAMIKEFGEEDTEKIKQHALSSVSNFLDEAFTNKKNMKTIKLSSLSEGLRKEIKNLMKNGKAKLSQMPKSIFENVIKEAVSPFQGYRSKDQNGITWGQSNRTSKKGYYKTGQLFLKKDGSVLTFGLKNGLPETFNSLSDALNWLDSEYAKINPNHKVEDDSWMEKDLENASNDYEPIDQTPYMGDDDIDESKKVKTIKLSSLSESLRKEVKKYVNEGKVKVSEMPIRLRMLIENEYNDNDLRTTSEKIKVRATSIENIQHPEWGTWGVMEDNGLWFDIIGRSGSRILSKQEADKFWRVVETKPLQSNSIKLSSLSEGLRKKVKKHIAEAESFYQGMNPKQAIEKATVDYNFALKNGNEGQADKIAGNLKSHLESQNYNWKSDPNALEILSDFISESLRKEVKKYIVENDDDQATRRSVKVHFEDGNSLVSAINGTKQEIIDYYVNNYFDMGTGEKEKMVKAIKVDFLDEGFTQKNTKTIFAIVEDKQLKDMDSIANSLKMNGCEIEQKFPYGVIQIQSSLSINELKGLKIPGVEGYYNELNARIL